MKNKLYKRALLGLPIGIAIGAIIPIIISGLFGNGTYYFATPELIEQTGSELNAVVLQTVLSGIIGVSFSAASLIWDIDSWSLAKQSAAYFTITSLVMLPVAYIANWMEHSLQGFVSYFSIFVVIFIIVWIVMYFFWRKEIEKINLGIQKGDQRQ